MIRSPRGPWLRSSSKLRSRSRAARRRAWCPAPRRGTRAATPAPVRRASRSRAAARTAARRSLDMTPRRYDGSSEIGVAMAERTSWRVRPMSRQHAVVPLEEFGDGATVAHGHPHTGGGGKAPS